MTNPFHLLLRPDPGQCLSRIVPSLTVAHTWRFHRGKRTSGPVWQGRFKSPVIQDDEHLLTVLRYSEANPLRGGMVTDLRDYAWSSYPAHGLGRLQEWVSECPNWQGLTPAPEARHAFWRGLVHTPLAARELASVRRCVTTGRPFGSVAWVGTTAQGFGDSFGRAPARPPAAAGRKNELTPFFNSRGKLSCVRFFHARECQRVQRPVGTLARWHVGTLEEAAGSGDRRGLWCVRRAMQ